jgi:DNA repair protein RecO (recombination protein O)
LKQSRFSSKAILLHSANFRESSLIGTFFTDEYGLIKLVARGARLKKNKLSNIKVPGAIFEIEFGGKGDLKNLYTCEIIDSIIIKESNLKIYLYLNEIIIRTIEPEAPVKSIFKSLISLYKDIQLSESPTERELKLRKFELDLISELGYEFSLTLDSKGKKIKEDLIYEFIPSKGFQVVNKESLKDVILGSSILKFNEGVFLNDQSKKFIKNIMKSSLDTISSKPLNSSKFFRLRKDAN